MTPTLPWLRFDCTLRFGCTVLRQANHIRLRQAATLSKRLTYRCDRVIDLHCHVLPGIDDGPSTIEESVTLVRAAAAMGIQTMVATPHVSWHYENDAETIGRLTTQLNARLRQEGVAVQILAGAEIAMTRADEIGAEELERLRLGDGPWLLLEPPFARVVTGLDVVVGKLQAAGHRVLLAHPERCPAFLSDVRALESLVRSDVLTSITAGSLTGRFGGEVRRFARRLVERGLVHNVASDAHDSLRRPPGIAGQLAEAGLQSLTDWYGRAVPEAVLSGADIPSAPILPLVEPRARRKRWRH